MAIDWGHSATALLARLRSSSTDNGHRKPTDRKAHVTLAYGIDPGAKFVVYDVEHKPYLLLIVEAHLSSNGEDYIVTTSLRGRRLTKGMEPDRRASLTLIDPEDNPERICEALEIDLDPIALFHQAFPHSH